MVLFSKRDISSNYQIFPVKIYLNCIIVVLTAWNFEWTQDAIGEQLQESSRNC